MKDNQHEQILKTTQDFKQLEANFAVNELGDEVAATWNGGAAYLYEDKGFGGRKLTFYKGHNDLRHYRFNDQTSSIKITAGETWNFYKHINYGGTPLQLSGGKYGREYDADYLTKKGFHDNISSLKRIA